MSLPECVFGPIQTQLQHSVHTIHPRRPPHLTCARWPHTSTSSPPRPLSQSRPTAMHPPRQRQPTLASCRQQRDTSCGCHRGDVAHRRRRLIPGPVACHPHHALPRAAAAAHMCHHYRPHRRPLPSMCRHRRCRRHPLLSQRHCPTPPHNIHPPPSPHPRPSHT